MTKPVAFSAIDQSICMTHAVEVAHEYRRQGLGREIMHQITDWADQQGAAFLSVLTVLENTPARMLYQSLGLKEVSHYHYRLHTDAAG